MTPEILYKHIQNIYNKHDFTKRLMIDNLMIISKDNYFQVLYQFEDKTSISIRLETNYKLTQFQTIYHLESEYEGQVPITIQHNQQIPKNITQYLLSILRHFNLNTILDNE